MSIPIENVYYLLCYAWDKLDEKDVVAVTGIESTSLADLFARVLINGTGHVLKRGFDRGYVPLHERTSRLRGRICFTEAVRNNGRIAPNPPCDFDELSYDVLHNQILKATLRRLIRAEGVAPESAQALARLWHMLADVRDIELKERVFGLVQLHRNNQFYDFLVKVCELIHRNLLVSEKSGTSKFMEFDQDEDQMAGLFEAFVRNFYFRHTTYRVRREDIQWNWIAADAVSERLLPKMQTDVSLTSDTRKIIIDCKYTANATRVRYSEKLNSSHLYQIHAYLNNLPFEELKKACEVMLLYPMTQLPVRATYTDQGRTVSIRTIDLNQSWPLIERDLLALVA